MSDINEAWVESVARAICTEISGRCMCVNHNAFQHAHCDYPKRSARAAIRALAPLIIEWCTEVARRHADAHARSLGAYGAADVDHGRGRQEGHIDAGNAIAQGILALNHFGGADEMVGALIQKEASDA